MTTDPIFTHAIDCELVGAFASDLAVANAARISLDTEHSEMDESDEKLIPFLLKNRHGSPFEHCYFKFRVEAPIFVFREHHRHRVGHSYNEMSGRYTELEPKFYVPGIYRKQIGKPGAYSFVDLAPHENIGFYHFCDATIQETYEKCWFAYQQLLREGLAKEQARIVLPVGIYTKMIWSCNPRSLMHFLGLRAEKSAQKEIQIVAAAAEAALAEHMPVTYAAFNEYGRQAP